jgi:hypothetical protein
MCESTDSGNVVGSRPLRYLIGSATGESMQEIGQTLIADSNLTIKQIVGPEENPVMIVAEMQPQHAMHLQTQFANQLIIEPDAPVFPASGSDF